MELVLLSLFFLFSIISVLGTSLFVGLLIGIWYSKYYYDKCEYTGGRHWPAFRDKLASLLYLTAKYYFAHDIRCESPEVKDLLAEARGVIIAGHPHGLFAIGSFYLLMATPNSFWKTVVPMVHRRIFDTPFVRDFALWCNARNVTKENIESVLDDNLNVYIAPGGCREMIERETGIQSKHTGFLRIAFEKKRLVFPVLHYGQEDIFKCYTFKALDIFRHITLDITGYPLPSFFLGPFPAKLRTVVIKPVDPTLFKSVKDFTEAYYKEVLNAYERHKEK